MLIFGWTIALREAGGACKVEGRPGASGCCKLIDDWSSAVGYDALISSLHDLSSVSYCTCRLWLCDPPLFGHRPSHNAMEQIQIYGFLKLVAGNHTLRGDVKWSIWALSKFVHCKIKAIHLCPWSGHSVPWKTCCHDGSGEVMWLLMWPKTRPTIWVIIIIRMGCAPKLKT